MKTWISMLLLFLFQKNAEICSSIPFAKIYMMLQYKLKMNGITLIKQNEAYTSQTSPLCESVTKESAKKNNRIKSIKKRGIFRYLFSL